MLRIPILNITQSSSTQGRFVVGPTTDNLSGDWTQIFLGKYYRDAAGNTLPFYSSASTPAGYTLVEATTFTVIDNPSYNGTYTVYTATEASDPSSWVPSPIQAQTIIKVNEPIGAPLISAHASTGFITNISTYWLAVAGGQAVVVPPRSIVENFSLDFAGRNFSGWGQVLFQNLVRQAQNFAGQDAPPNPFVGQTWFNTALNELRVWTGSQWNQIATTVAAPAFKHTQTPAASTWTVTHNLGAASPFIVDATFFVNVGGGSFKPILPSDVTFVNANQLTVTFTSPYSGYALVRL